MRRVGGGRGSQAKVFPGPFTTLSGRKESNLCAVGPSDITCLYTEDANGVIDVVGAEENMDVGCTVDVTRGRK